MSPKTTPSSNSTFRTNIETFREKLYLSAKARFSSRQQAQVGISDVVQETCLRAYRHLGSFRGTTQRQFGAWLQAILHHQLLNLFKRQHLKVDPHKVERSLPVQLIGQPGYHEETPSHIVMAQEEQLIMNHALQQLTAEERHILARHHRDQRTFAELGVELKCSEEAARKRWARALLRWQRLVQSPHA